MSSDNVKTSYIFQFFQFFSRLVLSDNVITLTIISTNSSILLFSLNYRADIF